MSETLANAGRPKGGMDRPQLWSIIDTIARTNPPGGLRLTPPELVEWLGIVAADKSCSRQTRRDAARASKHVIRLITGVYEMPNYSPPPDADTTPNNLPCGHPNTPDNVSPNYGCVACDSGAKPPAAPETPAALPAAGRTARPTPRADLHYTDCISGMREHLPAESVDLVVTSIPFEELFTYSGKPEDVGNNGSTVDIRAGRFALNMRFVVAEVARVLKPGCNACIHIQQLLAYKNQHGFMGRRDFRGAMVEVWTAAQSGGPSLNFYGEFVIPKDPQLAAQKLKLHSLQFKTGTQRNGCMLAPFVNDYVLIFQKPGDHPCPPKPLFDARKNPGGWMTTDEWVRDAHGVWSDIIEIDVLDGARGHKETDLEKHVCPLQLEVIRRCVRLYTNPIGVQPDVTVLDPFMGIGSTAYTSVGGISPCTKLKVEEPRNVVGFELKESYHRASLHYVGRALKGKPVTQADLFANT